jgi:hypothetical protein
MDTLMRTKKLEALGFDRTRAEGLVLMVKASIDEEVAKKVDLDQVKVSLNNKIDQVEVSLNNKIDQVEISLNNKIDQVETRLNTRIDQLDMTVKAEFKEVRGEIKRLEQTLGLKITSESKSQFIKIIILMITMTGIILRAMK